MSKPKDIALEASDVATTARPNAIVHLGWHKTGTTSIQGFLGINREALSDAGFDCADFLTDKGRIVHSLFGLAPSKTFLNNVHAVNLLRAYGIGSGDAAVKKIEAFEKELEDHLARSQAHTFLISSETLRIVFNTSEKISVLDEWLQARFGKVEYLAYVRRQDMYLESEYVQHIKGGARVSLEEYTHKNAVQDYYQFAVMWQNIVGRERFSIRLYDKELLVGHDSVQDYCAAVGIDLTGFKQPRQMNSSVGAVAVKNLIRLNRFAAFRRLRPRRRLKIAQFFGNGAKIRLTEELRNMVLAKNAESNERLRKSYFPEQPTLFSNSPASSDHNSNKRNARLVTSGVG